MNGSRFRIYRRDQLKKARLPDYLLMYLFATIIGCLVGGFVAPQVAGRAYVNANAPSVEAAQEWARDSVWVCLIAGVTLAWVILTISLISDKFEERRFLRETKQREDSSNRLLHEEWENQYGPRE
jgi:Interferon-induced transmembrane protein